LSPQACLISVIAGPRFKRVSAQKSKEHRAACFSRVEYFGTNNGVTSDISERKRGRDSNTGSNPVGATTVRRVIHRLARDEPLEAQRAPELVASLPPRRLEEPWSWPAPVLKRALVRARSTSPRRSRRLRAQQSPVGRDPPADFGANGHAATAPGMRSIKRRIPSRIRRTLRAKSPERRSPSVAPFSCTLRSLAHFSMAAGSNRSPHWRPCWPSRRRAPRSAVAVKRRAAASADETASSS
jgi:hypothetical protein